eukprot:11162481-Lingulodinium_polyedra.AAC.1
MPIEAKACSKRDRPATTSQSDGICTFCVFSQPRKYDVVGRWVARAIGCPKFVLVCAGGGPGAGIRASGYGAA